MENDFAARCVYLKESRVHAPGREKADHQRFKHFSVQKNKHRKRWNLLIKSRINARTNNASRLEHFLGQGKEFVGHVVEGQVDPGGSFQD